jgi:hypothetical protein
MQIFIANYVIVINYFLCPTYQIGLRLSRDGAKGSNTFAIDTGATINLIRKDVSEKMRGVYVSQQQLTSSFGGVTQIASTTARISDCCVSDTGMKLGSLDFSVLSHSSALPKNVDGLLGLQFLRSLILDSEWVVEIGKFNILISELPC